MYIHILWMNIKFCTTNCIPRFITPLLLLLYNLHHYYVACHILLDLVLCIILWRILVRVWFSGVNMMSHCFPGMQTSVLWLHQNKWDILYKWQTLNGLTVNVQKKQSGSNLFTAYWELAYHIYKMCQKMTWEKKEYCL